MFAAASASRCVSDVLLIHATFCGSTAQPQIKSVPRPRYTGGANTLSHQNAPPSSVSTNFAKRRASVPLPRDGRLDQVEARLGQGTPAKSEPMQAPPRRTPLALRGIALFEAAKGLLALAAA